MKLLTAAGDSWSQAMMRYLGFSGVAGMLRPPATFSQGVRFLRGFWVVGEHCYRAYNLIFNEWFRDENLMPSFMVDTGDGPDPNSYYSILNRGKRHDILLLVYLGLRRALPLIFLWAPRLL